MKLGWGDICRGSSGYVSGWWCIRWTDCGVFVPPGGAPGKAALSESGNQMIPLSLEAPRLLLPKPAPNGHTESMSLYVVCKWDLLKYPGDDANAVQTLLLGDAASQLPLEEKNARIVYPPTQPADDDIRVYELPATLFTKDGIPYTSWNIEWTKVGPPSCKLFSAASPITPTFRRHHRAATGGGGASGNRQPWLARHQPRPDSFLRRCRVDAIVQPEPPTGQ